MPSIFVKPRIKKHEKKLKLNPKKIFLPSSASMMIINKS